MGGGTTMAREQARPAVALLVGIFLAMLALAAIVASSGCSLTVKEVSAGFLKGGPAREAQVDKSALDAKDRELLARLNCNMAMMADVLFHYGKVSRADADERALNAFLAGSGRCAGDLGPITSFPLPPIQERSK